MESERERERENEMRACISRGVEESRPFIFLPLLLFISSKAMRGGRKCRTTTQKTREAYRMNDFF